MFYPAGFLNSPYVNERITSFMTQGLLGERDIHRRPFEVVPIPEFDKGNELHVRLADMAGKCALKVAKLGNRDGSTGAMRSKVREILTAEIAVIDDGVQAILNAAIPKIAVRKKAEQSGLSFD